MRDEPLTARKDRRRFAARWRLPMAVLLLSTVVGLGAAPRFLSDPARASRLAARLLPELDGDVVFQSVRIGWTGPLVLEGVRVVPRDGSAPPLSMARVEIGNGLAAILASFGDLGRVRVQGLEGDVVFDEGRRTNLAGLLRPSPDAGDRPARPARRSPVRMRLEVEAARVRITGPWSAAPWRSDPIDVVAALAPSADGARNEWAIEPVQLLADARLEPAVAQGVIAYVAPILAGATRTSGRFSLRLDGGRLPVGRPADGELSGTLVMHEVVVGPGPLVENLLAALPPALPVPPDIRIADESHVAFRLADRRVSHEGLEFGLPLARTGQRLDIRSRGSVGIDDGALDVRLLLPIPADLPRDRPVLAALAGKSVSIGIQGVLGDPRVAFDGSIKGAAVDFVSDLVDRLRDGEPPARGPADPGTASDDAAEQVVDAVVGLIEEIAKRRAERREAEQDDAGGAPPRRLRQRARGGRAAPSAP